MKSNTYKKNSNEIFPSSFFIIILLIIYIYIYIYFLKSFSWVVLLSLPEAVWKPRKIWKRFLIGGEKLSVDLMFLSAATT